MAIGKRIAISVVFGFVCSIAMAASSTAGSSNTSSAAATAAASGMAEADSAKVTFHFVVNKTDFTLDVPHSSLPSNKEALAIVHTYMDSFRSEGMLRLRQIRIQGVSSPDGLRARNQVLAQGRHDSVLGFLRSEFPEIPATLYLEDIVVEDWDGAARLLEQSEIIGKEEALSIIENTPLHIYNNGGKLVDSRKRQLMQLNRGETWRQMQSQIFPKLRKADIWFYYEPVTRSNDNNNDTDKQNGIGANLGIAGLMSSLVVLPESLRPTLSGIPALAASARDIERPLFAVGTNLLYDALITPNISVEVPLGHHWSIQAAYTFPWWVNRANDMAWQILKWDLGARWWFSPKNLFNPMDVLRGHFVGLELSAGYYDVEPKHSGWQGEAVVATLEYGYSWRLGKNWRLSTCIGAGWLYSPQYRAYQGTQDDKHLIYQHNGNLNWIGPTKASVGIQYLFHYTKKHKRK